MNPFNPEAGDVPAPTDPLEIDVARRAAALAWRALPYLQLRYGERGRRFGLSDGGWLVTLAQLPAEVRRGQLDWLSGLLAARGMPSWLLEVQLAATARVGRRMGWRGAVLVRDDARYLGDRRRSTLPDTAFAEAGRRFIARAGQSRLAIGTGQLIASAQVDAALGICRSTGPLLEWLADSSRFDPSWCAAVEQTRQYVAAALTSD